MTAASRPSQVITVALLFVALASGVARLQPRLAREAAEIKVREDVYVLPPPAELRVLTLGYVAAATDLLWSKLLVEYGIHFAERRAFPDLNHYLDAIVELDPAYKNLYDFVDTLILFRPSFDQKGRATHATEEDARAARAYLTRGTLALPYDPDVWTRYGQFMAFVAPGVIASPEEQDRWRKDGDAALVHAAELGGDAQMTLAATSMLTRRFGEKDAAIRALSRLYALTDNEAVRAEIGARLEMLQASRERDAAETAVETIDARWRREFPFLTRDAFLLLGPKTDPAACAGLLAFGRRDCAESWDAVVGGSN